CFESEQQALVKLWRRKHLRRSLDEDIVLTEIRVKRFRIPDGWSPGKGQLCWDFSHNSYAGWARPLAFDAARKNQVTFFQPRPLHAASCLPQLVRLRGLMLVVKLRVSNPQPLDNSNKYRWRRQRHVLQRLSGRYQLTIFSPRHLRRCPCRERDQEHRLN